MTRPLTVFVVFCAGLLVLGPAARAVSEPMPPGFDDGFGDSFGGATDMGPPSWFVALFVLTVIAGIAVTLYRVSLARQIARDSGMDPDQATAMTLLSDNGLDAAYLASNLRGSSGADQPSDPTPEAGRRSVNERLRELQQLRDEGLVTYEEFETRRKEILDSL